MNPIISLDEMRARIAEKLFGDDSIDDLTEEQYELLKLYGPRLRDVSRTDGSTIKLNHIAAVPETLRTKLDLALGRQARMDAQFTTVDSWIQDHGLPVDPRRTAERSKFNKLIRLEFPTPKEGEDAPRKTGPKATILPHVMGEMRKQLDSGKLTEEELFDLTDKELEARFAARQERCRVARKRVLNERQAKK
jgi:hypothetical protein